MKIVIGCDHAGYEYKEAIVRSLKRRGYDVMDKGTHSDQSVDYPDFVHPVALSIADKNADLGILICGSGNGVAITANKHQEVRAALCWKVELAELAKQHNNANVVCIPARFISLRLSKKIVNAFVSTPFEGGRHRQRVEKIPYC